MFAFRVFENSFGEDSDENERKLNCCPPEGMFRQAIHQDPMTGSTLLHMVSTARLTREHRTVWDSFRLLQIDPNVQLNETQHIFMCSLTKIWQHNLIA